MSKQKLFYFILFFSGFCINVQAQVGIGTTQPKALLHVANGPVLFSAEGNIPSLPAPTPVTGSGRRMMWYPDKAAFRVGMAQGNEWDTENVGKYSFASGWLSIASGQLTTAMGWSSTASGEGSVAIGYEATASGARSTALGVGVIASGLYSNAMGFGTTASGFHSTTMGAGTTASGDYSTTMGLRTTAGAYGSLVIGRFNVTGNYSSDEWVNNEPLFVAGNGTISTGRNALTLYKNGNLTISGTLSQNSDARLKANIHLLPEALNRLLALNGYQYNWNTEYADSSELHTGLLAQEVQNLMPELVSEDVSGTLSVNYNGLVPYLIEGVKEQQKTIENLSSSQKEMEELIRSQQALIYQLNKRLDNIEREKKE